MRTVVENRQDRLALATDAGWGRISVTSVVAGILVGYGASHPGRPDRRRARRSGRQRRSTGADLRRTGSLGGIVLGVVLLVSWYFGAYTAGRMARRAGVTHGVLVFFIGVLVAVAAASAVEALGATDDVIAGLQRLGVPTTADQWADIGTVAGIASLVGMLAGCLLGAAAGERWHAKLLTRALNPGVGPEGYALAAERKSLAARARRRYREANLTRRLRPVVDLDDAVCPPATESRTGPAAARLRSQDTIESRSPGEESPPRNPAKEVVEFATVSPAGELEPTPTQPGTPPAASPAVCTLRVFGSGS